MNECPITTADRICNVPSISSSWALSLLLRAFRSRLQMCFAELQLAEMWRAFVAVNISGTGSGFRTPFLGCFTQANCSKSNWVLAEIGTSSILKLPWVLWSLHVTKEARIWLILVPLMTDFILRNFQFPDIVVFCKVSMSSLSKAPRCVLTISALLELQ